MFEASPASLWTSWEPQRLWPFWEQLPLVFSRWSPNSSPNNEEKSCSKDFPHHGWYFCVLAVFPGFRTKKTMGTSKPESRHGIGVVEQRNGQGMAFTQKSLRHLRSMAPHLHTYMRINLHVRVCVYIYTCIQYLPIVYMYVCIYIYVCTHYMCVYTYIHVHMYLLYVSMHTYSTYLYDINNHIS